MRVANRRLCSFKCALFARVARKLRTSIIVSQGEREKETDEQNDTEQRQGSLFKTPDSHAGRPLSKSAYGKRIDLTDPAFVYIFAGGNTSTHAVPQCMNRNLYWAWLN